MEQSFNYGLKHTKYPLLIKITLHHNILQL